MQILCPSAFHFMSRTTLLFLLLIISSYHEPEGHMSKLNTVETATVHVSQTWLPVTPSYCGTLNRIMTSLGPNQHPAYSCILKCRLGTLTVTPAFVKVSMWPAGFSWF